MTLLRDPGAGPSPLNGQVLARSCEAGFVVIPATQKRKLSHREAEFAPKVTHH